MDLHTQKLLTNAIKLHRSEKYQPAKAIYLQILKSNPNNVAALHLLGVLHSEQKEFIPAIEYLKKALSLNPTMPQLYHNLGLAYKESGQTETAKEHFKQAILLNPNYGEAYYKLGSIYKDLGELKTATTYFEKAIKLTPDNANIWLLYGNTLSQLFQLHASKQCLKKALTINPNLAEAHFNLGLLCKELKEYEKSIYHLQQSEKLAPHNSSGFIFLFRLNEETCNWENYSTHREKLIEINKNHQAANKRSPINVFASLSLNLTPPDLAEIARKHSQLIIQDLRYVIPKFQFQYNPKLKSPLKIAYLSAHFRDHPTAHLTQNLYASHDRKHFEVSVFSVGGRNDTSQYRQHIAASCDHFFDLTAHTDAEAATKIHNQNIDILIDLDGYINQARPQICALRPAPIQVAYLGFPGTLGAPYYDYLIADETLITPAAATTYNEKIVYMPHSYQINNDQQIIAEISTTRQDYQLPDDTFVYCCFNNNYKIEPQIFTVWMDILTNAPKSVLWLFASSTFAENNLRREAKKHNIDSERLIFAKREEKSLHLARHKFADLFLDTLVYNAHTTASDALWAGLPLLTTPGVNFASRVGASLLKAVGLPELIMSDLKAYRDKALYFYQHREELQKIREKLLTIRKTSPLFNTKHFVHNLEQAYLKMTEIYDSGQAPQTIYVKEKAVSK